MIQCFTISRRSPASQAGLYRQLLALGQDCEVVAPPRSERIKTDRRDALKLARLLRAGELREVWVPDAEHEAMRPVCLAETVDGVPWGWTPLVFEARSTVDKAWRSHAVRLKRRRS